MKKTLLATALLALVATSASAYTVAESADKETNVKLTLNARVLYTHSADSKATGESESYNSLNERLRFSMSSKAKVNDDVSFGTTARLSQSNTQKTTTNTPVVGAVTTTKTNTVGNVGLDYAQGYVKSKAYGTFGYGKYYSVGAANDFTPSIYGQGFEGAFSYTTYFSHSLSYESPTFDGFSFAVGYGNNWKSDYKTTKYAKDYTQNYSLYGKYAQGDHEVQALAFLDTATRPESTDDKKVKTESAVQSKTVNLGAAYSYTGFKYQGPVTLNAVVEASNKHAVSGDFTTKQALVGTVAYAPEAFKPYDTTFTLGASVINEKAYAAKDDKLTATKKYEVLAGGYTKVYSGNGLSATVFYEYMHSAPFAQETTEKFVADKAATAVKANKFDSNNTVTLALSVTY